MTPEQYGDLIRQHLEISANLERLWFVFIVLVFLGVLFLGCMFGLAAWSVSRVNKRQSDLEAKFVLLIDVLLTTERNRQGGSSQSV